MLTTELVAQLLKEGIELSYQDISVCEITNRFYTSSRRHKSYQVYCDSFLLHFAEEYTDLEICADKFIALKNQLDKLKRDHARNIRTKKQDTELPKVSTISSNSKRTKT